MCWTRKTALHRFAEPGWSQHEAEDIGRSPWCDMLGGVAGSSMPQDFVALLCCGSRPMECTARKVTFAFDPNCPALLRKAREERNTALPRTAFHTVVTHELHGACRIVRCSD